jgi:hypothetical protein
VRAPDESIAAIDAELFQEFKRRKFPAGLATVSDGFYLTDHAEAAAAGRASQRFSARLFNNLNRKVTMGAANVHWTASQEANC